MSVKSWLYCINVCFLSLVLSSCSQFNFEKPNVSLLNFGLEKSNSILGSSFVLDLKVSNPNSIALPLNAMSYSFSIGNAKLLTGVTNNLSPIEAYGSQNIKLTLDANILAVPKLLGLLNKPSNISYLFDAKLNMSGLVPNIHVSQKGNLADIK